MRKIPYYLAIIVCLAFLPVYYGCHQAAVKTTPVKSNGSFSANGSVREIVLDLAATEFPEHEGKKEFVAYCGICHSLKYISMQPDFSAKIWATEVHKMVEKYGAPIDSVNSDKIVQYLVAIKLHTDK